jgi:hypothetical protein
MQGTLSRSHRGAFTWQRARAGFMVAGLLLAPVQLLAEPGTKTNAEKKKDQGIRLHLKADFQAGFAPLTITFTGRIKNLNLEDAAFCHAGTYLVRKLITDEFQIVAGEDPVCLHPPDKRDISPTFSHTYTVHSSGSYEFFAMVVTTNGRRITSNGVPVRVLSSPGGP